MDKRRDTILELITRHGRVKVAELSRMFGISEVTIRNDLSELEEAGLLERVHGGAVSTNKAYYNMSFNERMRTNEDEKRRIAAACAAMITNGDTIMVNSGTTALFVVQALRGVKNLTIVTNCISAAQEAAAIEQANVILLGGNFNPWYQFTYGDDTLEQLKRYKADKLILSADGVSAETGITTYHHLEAEVNRQMIARSKWVIVVADYTKIGRESFARIDSIENVDTVVTNREADEEETALIAEKGVKIRLT